MLSDYHLHSHFSGDCKVPMVEMVEKAIELGIDKLCFTDHHDLDFPHPTLDFTLDIKPYIKQIQEYQNIYGDKIKLLIGIELGMQHHLHNQLTDIVHKNPFDFVIASNHLAKGLDVYDKIYFQNRSQYKGYLEYFEDMLGNVKNYQDYDIYGHLDYVIRYGEFENKVLAYQDFKELLDEILKTIISNGKGIEVNSSGYRYRLNNPHPSSDILKHYKDLGGSVISLGSDAHMTKHLTCDFDKSIALLKSLGFKHHVTFEKRQAQFHPFD